MYLMALGEAVVVWVVKGEYFYSRESAEKKAEAYVVCQTKEHVSKTDSQQSKATL